MGGREEDESGGTTEASSRKDEARTMKEGRTDQVQKQEPTLLVTDSWRLANKCMVVAELSMPPSQESSSDSVFTDPEELAAIAAKEEAARTPSIARNQQRVEPSSSSSVSPLFGKPLFVLRIIDVEDWETRVFRSKPSVKVVLFNVINVICKLLLLHAVEMIRIDRQNGKEMYHRRMESNVRWIFQFLVPSIWVRTGLER